MRFAWGVSKSLCCVPCRFQCQSPRRFGQLPELHLIGRNVREYWILFSLLFYSWQMQPGGLSSRSLWLTLLAAWAEARASLPAAVACGLCNWLEPVAHQLLAAVCVIFMMRPEGSNFSICESSFWLPCRKRCSGYILATFKPSIKWPLKFEK